MDVSFQYQIYCYSLKTYICVFVFSHAHVLLFFRSWPLYLVPFLVTVRGYARGKVEDIGAKILENSELQNFFNNKLTLAKCGKKEERT
jgi:NADH:ubiquinone oxidoreductase subunit 4 (subunit M)